MAFLDLALFSLLLNIQVFIVQNEPDNRRPIWNIGHMVNTVNQTAEFLDAGANGLEFDVSFTDEGEAQYTFHGVPCDCFRSCLYYANITDFLDHLRQLTTPGDPIFRKELVMLVADLKVGKLSAEGLRAAGEDVAKKFLEYYWSGENETKSYIMISIPLTKHVAVMESLLQTLRNNNASEHIPKIGLDFSGNEDIDVIKANLEVHALGDRFWLSDGITNCLPRDKKRLMECLRERDTQVKPVDKVYWWTVDKKETMQSVLWSSVDAIITNFPDRLASILQDDHSQYLRLATFEDNPWQTFGVITDMTNKSLSGNYTFYNMTYYNYEEAENDDDVLYN